MAQRTTAGVCQGPPRENESFVFKDVACFLLVAFLHSFLFWLEYELSVRLARITFRCSTPNLQKTLYRRELIL